MKKLIWTLVLLGFVWGLSGAQAGEEPEAVDLAKACAVSVSENTSRRSRMLDGRIDTYWDNGNRGTFSVRLPGGEKAQGVMLTFFGDAPRVTVTDESGEVLANWEEGFYNAWIPFSAPAAAFTVSAGEGENMSVSRLYVLSEGRLPDWVQRWEVMEDDAELMLIVTHPDDDILWFGGLLPYYASEQGRRVQVVYMVGGANRTRRIELLDALWHCHVKYYPVIGTFPDKGISYISTAVRNWGGEENIDAFIAAQLSAHRPLVVVTQDLKGEYGHNHHRVTAAAVVRVITGADPDVWRPLKLYIHLYGENRIEFNWDRPMETFGGKTGIQIAREAFRMHVSQQNGNYRVAVHGTRYDSGSYGLYWSKVGPDVEKDDMFENVPAR